MSSKSKSYFYCPIFTLRFLYINSLLIRKSSASERFIRMYNASSSRFSPTSARNNTFYYRILFYSIAYLSSRTRERLIKPRLLDGREGEGEESISLWAIVCHFRQIKQVTKIVVVKLFSSIRCVHVLPIFSPWCFGFICLAGSQLKYWYFPVYFFFSIFFYFGVSLVKLNARRLLAAIRSAVDIFFLLIIYKILSSFCFQIAVKIRIVSLSSDAINNDKCA